jgi:hypothetical protein
LASICTLIKKYYDIGTKNYEIFTCDQEALEKKDRCLFHDENFLKDVNHPENKYKVIKKLQERIKNSEKNKVPLKCIGYYLPNIELYKEVFTQQVYFNHCKFQKADFINTTFSSTANFSDTTFSSTADFYATRFKDQANFSDTTFSSTANFFATTISGEANFFATTFSGEANFARATFSGEANFARATFSDKSYFSGRFELKTHFNYVTFRNPNEIRFEIEDMSKVSFIYTDISDIQFSNNVKWKVKDNFQVIEETWLEEDMKKNSKDVRARLGEVLSVYRNLRQNYENNRRYFEAGKFFNREMELNRNYREVEFKLINYTPDQKIKTETNYNIKKNCWFRRNIFSLIGWNHILSNYGESLWRPFATGIAVIFIFTLFFATQSDPYQAPSFSYPFYSTNNLYQNINNNSTTANTVNKINDSNQTNSLGFVTLDKLGDLSQWNKSLIRTLGDFIPFVSMPNDIKIGLIDYVIKIVGGAVTFGLIATVIRSRFQRINYNL